LKPVSFKLWVNSIQLVQPHLLPQPLCVVGAHAVRRVDDALVLLLGQYREVLLALGQVLARLRLAGTSGALWANSQNMRKRR
jgi:hypothetical protein